MELNEKDLALVIAVVKALDKDEVGKHGAIHAPFVPHYEPGKCYFFQTVTAYYTGRLIRETESDYFINEASWIPDTGRHSDFMRTGVPNECEPFPAAMEVRVPKGGMIESCSWPHPLPREVK